MYFSFSECIAAYHIFAEKMIALERNISKKKKSAAYHIFAEKMIALERNISKKKKKKAKL